MNQRKGSKLSTLANDQLLPREELYKRSPRNIKLNIGIPDNSSSIEYSVPLTPQSVEVVEPFRWPILLKNSAVAMRSSC